MMVNPMKSVSSSNTARPKSIYLQLNLPILNQVSIQTYKSARKWGNMNMTYKKVKNN